MLLCVRLVVFCNCSPRGAAAVMREFAAFHGLKTPSHMSIQNWTLKYGVGWLTGRVERRRDWVFILDHMVEFGTQKCLLVLGLPRGKFRRNRCRVSHADVSVLGIIVEDKMNAVKINETLAEISAASGAPVQIITDHGSDIKKGVEDFIATLPVKPVYTYDITHKTAVMLKRLLKDDASWEKFVRKSVDTKRLVLQTVMGHLAPPKPSDKARWLNLDKYAAWGEEVAAHIAGARLDPSRHEEAEKLGTVFGWLDDFSSELALWGMIVRVLQAAKDEVKVNGLDKGTKARFLRRLEKLDGDTGGAEEATEELLSFFDEQTANLPDDDKWLGTSDIIESVFGKYKRFSQRASIKGVGKIVLMIPVFTGRLTMKKLNKAMETIRCADVKKWINDKLGVSFFAKRRRALGVRLKSKNTMKLFPVNPPKAVDF